MSAAPDGKTTLRATQSPGASVTAKTAPTKKIYSRYPFLSSEVCGFSQKGLRPCNCIEVPRPLVEILMLNRLPIGRTKSRLLI